ncbi:oxidoreductase [Bacteroidia bacterium]|nr:oxidoreductase [Bacteroidia bacterium]
MNNPFSLENKNIIVTGASSGIGRQTAVACAKMGANVVLIARNTEKLQETLHLMQNTENHKVIGFDVSDFENIGKTIDEIVREKGKINGFVHCAGMELTVPFIAMKAAHYKEIFNVNTIAAFEFVRHISKKKYAADKLSLVLISSIAAHCGQAGLAAYSMSKSALTGGIKSLAVELAPKSIRINTIEPGWVLGTNMTQKYDNENNAPDKSLYPLGYGQTADVANACVYLLSNAAQWVTGTNLIVDGGYSAK